VVGGQSALGTRFPVRGGDSRSHACTEDTELTDLKNLSQLRLLNLPVGLLINFNVECLSDGGIKRVVNGRYKPPTPIEVQPESDNHTP